MKITRPVVISPQGPRVQSTVGNQPIDFLVDTGVIYSIHFRDSLRVSGKPWKASFPEALRMPAGKASPQLSSSARLPDSSLGWGFALQVPCSSDFLSEKQQLPLQVSPEHTLRLQMVLAETRGPQRSFPTEISEQVRPCEPTGPGASRKSFPSICSIKGRTSCAWEKTTH